MDNLDPGRNEWTILDLSDRQNARPGPGMQPVRSSIGEVPLGGGSSPSAARVEPREADALAAAQPGGERVLAADSNVTAAPPSAAPETSKVKHPRATRQGTGGLWAALVVLALALGGMAWYGRLAMRRNNVSVAQLPGMQKAVSGLSGRVAGAEDGLRGFAANWDGLQSKLARLDRKVSAGFQVSRQQAEALVNQAQARLENEIAAHDQAVNARFGRLEAAQQAQDARLAELQSQVGSVRQEMASSEDETNRQLSDLNGGLNEDRQSLGDINQRLARQKVTFEALKGAPVELVPGVTMTVTKTDVSYQRYAGYLSLEEEGRTLWLSNVSAQQSVGFYAGRREQAINLVVTGVNSGGVAGYVMVPAAGSVNEPSTPESTGAAGF